jgi:tRNA(Ile)-lysidine synthase
MDVCDRVVAYIREHHLLRPGQLVVTAVSGGADSLCLLDCLRRLGYRVVLAHFDHRLREGSERDAEFVLALAQRHGLRAVVGREDVRASAHGRSLEDAARLARYRFLARVAHEHRSRVIATGHTTDDQAETVLLHLLRGAGPAGLSGMRPATPLHDWPDLMPGRPLTLIRPLLAISRADTRAHCASIGLTPREDPSNTDPSFVRNRIRLELMPQLATYNPGIRETLDRTARLMRDVADLVEDQARAAWPETVRRAGRGSFALNALRLGRLPRAVQGELIRRALRVLGPEASEIGLDEVERVLVTARTARPPRRVTIGAGLEAERMGEEVILRLEGAAVSFPQVPQLTSWRARRVRVDAAIALASGWGLSAREVRLTPIRRKALIRNPEPRLAAFDAADLPSRLQLRPPAAGDRLHPLGLKGSVKIADLLIDRHIPRLARERWPILVAEGAPIWVAGLRQGREARLTSRSKRALILQLVAPSAP